MNADPSERMTRVKEAMKTLERDFMAKQEWPKFIENCRYVKALLTQAIAAAEEKMK